MRFENYSTLKSASKVAFSKDGDIVKLTEKRFNPSTGEVLSDAVSIVELTEYERDKTNLESEKVNIESQITGLAAIITDIKAL